jgi:transcriptional regulator with XRE-family HTH domain
VLLAATLVGMSPSEQLDVRSLGRRIADRRADLRIEQTELAERAGLSRAYVSRLEGGIVANPKILDLQRIAAVLDLPLASLITPQANSREIHAATCAELMAQLEGEPPEVVEDVIAMFRLGVHAITRRRDTRRAREN